MRCHPAPLAAVLSLILGACQSAYYGAFEKIGIHKRDILVDRVGDARDEQEDTKKQVVTALERFRAVAAFEGGELEEKYSGLKQELERTERRAGALRDRISSVEKVADALFDEWEDEFDDYTDPKLKRRSRERLDATRARYGQLMKKMHRVEKKLEPALVPLRDYVLYLKHNLNARALASLETESRAIQTNIEALVKDMDAAVREANAFIEAVENGREVSASTLGPREWGQSIGERHGLRARDTA